MQFNINSYPAVLGVIIIFHRLSTENVVSRDISKIAQLLIPFSGLTPL